MSILDANGAMACAECGRQARAVRDRFKAENEKLRDENARLRSCLSDDADNARQIMGENDKLRERVHELEIEYDGATTAVLEKTERIEWLAGRLRGETNENDRLRELVRDMYAAFVHGNCYRWCEFKEPCNYISDGKCQWYDRMAELGVEVES